MWGTGAHRLVAVAGVVALLATGCGTIRDFFGEPAVFDTGIEPLTLELEGPAYTAAVPGGLLVRHGAAEVVVPGASSTAWLSDGRVLAVTGRAGELVWAGRGRSAVGSVAGRLLPPP